MSSTQSPTAEPKRIFLKDYRPFSHLIDQVDLRFVLAPNATRVFATITMRPNPDAGLNQDLRLDGENLVLRALSVEGRALAITPDATGLTIPAENLPQNPFTLETEVEIDPAANTALEGLYMSGGIYCSQCEAEGFRKITFYPDRPDVMARFKVRIESDMPILLSNGNPVEMGAGFAQWDDPWHKPAYLFALVAGDLVAFQDRFTTMSGREVALNIWVRKGDETRCAWAMDSLIRSMKWDEEVYGREYDLDVFNIVAVDDFNMGAMENKGLNIFNSKFVLADAETASDDDFARIEAIIAHEYFHNWTGNRITCRDWFQLCLKEGLTVFRDQQFSGDMRSHAVKRIEDVALLRARQFREDQGPLAHPVRPESFVEINNFYTATIYEKGAEIISMLKTLVGDEGYADALDLYFARHDGDAATIEDWLKVFEDETGRDLSQFKLWYSEAGTPHVSVEEDYDAGELILTLSQRNPPTPDQAEKAPKLIPVAVGLLGANGQDLIGTKVLELSQESQSFRFPGLSEKPVLSILRGFSAPVVLERGPVPAKERAFVLAHDSDLFNRFEAGRSLARDVILGADPALWLDAMVALITDHHLDPAFRALALRLPSEDEMAASVAAEGNVPDPAQLHQARKTAQKLLAERLAHDFGRIDAALPAKPDRFTPDAAGAGARALRAGLLSLQTLGDGGAQARAAFASADNMTDMTAALQALLHIGQGAEELAAFRKRFQDNRNVMDKWFMWQVTQAPPEALVDTVNRLTADADFDMKNPNRFRAVFGALSANHAGFHHTGGAAYRLLADWLIQLDALNPQTAARMSGAFEVWPRYDAARQALIKAELLRIKASPTLSRDLGEMVTRMLG